MQISRHWRMNANRYRLEGYALPSGEKALQPRASRPAEEPKATDDRKPQEQRALTAA